MSFLKRLLGGSSRSSTPVFDPFLDDAPVRKAYEDLVTGSWQRAESLLAVRPDDWWLQSVLIGEHSAIPVSAFSRWADASPSALTLSLLGAAKTREAWAMRGGSTASDADDRSWEPFLQGLEEAEADLWDAVDIDPTSSDPWVRLLTTGRGLRVGRDELQLRFDHAHAGRPFRPDACAALLQCLCKKWHGSHGEMFTFARWVEQESAPGAAAREVLPMAHLERAIDPEAGERPTQYFKRPDVSLELRDGLELFLESTPVDASSAQLGVLNAYALALIPFDAASGVLVRECYDRIGDRPTELPWAYYGDVGGRFGAFRSERLALASLY